MDKHGRVDWMTKNRVRSAIANIQQCESNEKTNAFSEHYVSRREPSRMPAVEPKPLRLEVKIWDDSDLMFSEAQACRDVNLRLMGFQSYADYLQSAVWEWVRSQLLQDERFASCLVCGSCSGLQWHHRTYSFPVLIGNFSSVDAGPIIRLCSECHCEVAHKDFPSLEESDRRLMQLRMLLINGESYKNAKHAAVKPFVSEKWQ